MPTRGDSQGETGHSSVSVIPNPFTKHFHRETSLCSCRSFCFFPFQLQYLSEAALHRKEDHLTRRQECRWGWGGKTRRSPVLARACFPGSTPVPPRCSEEEPCSSYLIRWLRKGPGPERMGNDLQRSQKANSATVCFPLCSDLKPLTSYNSQPQAGACVVAGSLHPRDSA